MVWLVAALAVALTHRWVPEATWLMIHLVMLGAVSHAVLVWSGHFSRAVLRSRDDEGDQLRERLRLLLFAGGAAAVLVGVPIRWWPLVVAGAVVAVGAVGWHAVTLLAAVRRSLGGRFGITVGYYVAAACWLPVGAGFGVLLARGLDETWHTRLLVAHSLTMLLGWIGLTVVGTLVTFWPTVLRSRMDDRAARLARQALPVVVVGVAVVVTGALTGLVPVVLAGLVGYGVGLGWVGRSFLAPLRRRPPREFASASILAGGCWFAVAAVATGAALALLPPDELVTAYPTLAGIWVVGFALQLVTGALSHLLPAVVGGGPSVVRVTAGWFNRAAAFRLAVINGGLLVALLPVGGWVRVTTSGLVVLALASFLVIMVGGIRAGVRAKRDHARPDGERAEWRPALSARGWLAGLVTLALVVSLGVALGQAPASSGSTSTVAPSGTTVEVTVEARDMRFVPDHVEVGRGDEVVITVINTDPTTPHDLRIGDQQTGRIAPGDRGTLALGPVAGSIEGWCTVVGHRAMGMVFTVIVDDAPVPAGDDPTTGTDAGGVPIGDGPLSRTVDPVLPPAPDRTVHRVELRVRDVPVEVAPGVWQRRWTYNGGPIGPTLRGRVGDVFEVTLVNDGTMGHSIDFHASAVAPEGPMRTVPPGESLVLRFTAERAGAWMYHCGSEPMSAHIAAGLHGALIIDPPDLPPVDREYVLVQSEVYLAGDVPARSAEDAVEVDAAAAMAGARPDLVVFNGIAGQYDQRPLIARVGERVRIWVVDAGPNRATSLHVIGGRFDTVYREGGYLLRDGRDPFGGRSGGAQALGLQPAQGGFVELVFPEAGHYPVVSHVMADAERGAAGMFHVTD